MIIDIDFVSYFERVNFAIIFELTKFFNMFFNMFLKNRKSRSNGVTLNSQLSILNSQFGALNYFSLPGDRKELAFRLQTPTKKEGVYIDTLFF